MHRLALFLVVPIVFASVRAGPALAGYSWPLRPFYRQHAIRAFFGDPRREFTQASFHFGVDIVAKRGTPVYAVSGGTAYIARGRVAVADLHKQRVFGYWHIRPVVGEHALVRLHQLLGYVMPGWGHLHLAEREHSLYVNPLRPGALNPYLDDSSPTIQSIGISRNGQRVPRSDVTGRVSLTASAYDMPSARISGRWSQTRVAPALITFKITTLRGQVVIPWRRAVDFRYTIPPPEDFFQIYAPGTHENRSGRPGQYRFYLLRNWQTNTLPNGWYRITVRAEDTRNNLAQASLLLRITNPNP